MITRNRRKFLKYMAAGTATVAGGSGLWLAKSRSRAARWMRTMIDDAKRPVLQASAKPEPSKWSDDRVTLCWIGHSTVLINFYGINILTDPAFGKRVGISLGLGTAGPKRYLAPALTLKELPPIDVLLLSHAHIDHMDLPSLGKFQRDTFAVTAMLTSEVVSKAGLRAPTELGWDETVTHRHRNGQLTIEAVQVKHWPSELERGYNGYILRREGKSLLFAGDTANTSLLAQVRSRGPFAAAIMPIGAYRPWIWNHCDPEQAVEMASAAGASFIIPVHHQTFKLSDEPMDEPIQRFEQALSREPERIGLKRVGETFTCPA